MILKMHVNRNVSHSLTLKNATLTTYRKTRGAISCARSTTKPTAPTIAGVYIGMDNAAVGGIDML